jgi:hypothetical protein
MQWLVPYNCYVPYDCAGRLISVVYAYVIACSAGFSLDCVLLIQKAIASRLTIAWSLVGRRLQHQVIDPVMVWQPHCSLPADAALHQLSVSLS